MQAGFKGVIDCIKAFSETDFTEDLKKIDVPTLIMHGDDDQIVPIGASALLSSKLVKGSTLKVYPGLSHGMCTATRIRSTPTCSRSSRAEKPVRGLGARCPSLPGSSLLLWTLDTGNDASVRAITSPAGKGCAKEPVWAMTSRGAARWRF